MDPPELSPELKLRSNRFDSVDSGQTLVDTRSCSGSGTHSPVATSASQTTVNGLQNMTDLSSALPPATATGEDGGASPDMAHGQLAANGHDNVDVQVRRGSWDEQEDKVRTYKDNIMSLLSTSSLMSLSQTSKAWHELITKSLECEIVWQRKCEQEFKFPTRQSGRRSGFLALFKRLAKSSCYVWGSKDNGRLGIASADNSLRERIIHGGISIPTRIQVGTNHNVVALAAGGWSFHALTSKGQVLSWGTFDGGQFVMGNAPLSNPGRIIQQPMLNPCREQMGDIVDLKAGRAHVVAKSSQGHVFEYRSLGRTTRVQDREGRWGGDHHSETAAIEAGWEHSLVLMNDGRVFIWWQPSPTAMAEGAEQAGEQDLSDATRQGVWFPVQVDSVQLPALPEHLPDEAIRLVASGDSFVVALTTAGRLFFCDVSDVPDQRPGGGPRLGGAGTDDLEDSPDRSQASRERLQHAFMSGRRGWTLMNKFCQSDDVRQLKAFATNPPSRSMRITHISAHFQTFFAYSVPSGETDAQDSIVLKGDYEWHENVEPIVIPELQHRSVIKVAQGDYHNLALTSDGHVLSWGSFSSGALGLGHPQLLDTPLSAPATPATTSQQPTAEAPPRRAHQGQPGVRFPGFVRTRPIEGRIPPPPDKIETPMLIRFPGDDMKTTVSDLSRSKEAESSRKKGKFVFEITASGWHSGALAVDVSDTQTDEEAEEGPVIRLLDSDPQQNSGASLDGFDRIPEGIAPPRRGVFGRGVFRIGFAGRGAMRRNLNPDQ
ncbi:hypothetical protein OIO90_002990 [Microbotryomycetes sp. JL221]|nr:hypothetical protein OIO90_002990 [Microbotryomycetes sp. JL221]